MPTLQRNAEFAVEPRVDVHEEPEDAANQRRFVSILFFVIAFATVSLVVYLFLRPPNRHLEATPYDGMIAQLRTTMSEQEVLALFRTYQDAGTRGELSAYDDGGSRRVVAFKLDSDEPLSVKLAPGSSRSVVEWCYRDHCHDNIE